MYFYEEGECILNVESAITQPEDFMKVKNSYLLQIGRTQLL